MLFSPLVKLTSISGNLITDETTTMSMMFARAGCDESVTSFHIDVSNWNVSNVINMEYMFNNAGYNTTNWEIGNLDNWNVSNVQNMFKLFIRSGYNSQTWSVGDLSRWDTSNVTSMWGLFESAGYNSSDWTVGNLSKWNISKLVTSPCNVFTNIRTLGLSTLTSAIELWNCS